MIRLLNRLLCVAAVVLTPAIVMAQEPQAGAPSSCIAIVLPGVQGVEGDATSMGASVRDLFASFLRGPSMQVVLLEARLAVHAVEEARLKGCGHLLNISITHKRGSGGSVLGRIVGRAGTQAAWGMPSGGAGGAIVRGATVATTQAVSELAASTRARDEVRLEYSVTWVESRKRFGPKHEKLKARSDGEDLVTPLVERAAEAIVAATAERDNR